MASEHIKEKQGWRLYTAAMPLKRPTGVSHRRRIATFQKVKALNYLRWLCRQRDKPHAFVLWHFEHHGDTMKSYTDVLLGWVIYAVLFLSHSSHFMNKSCKRRQSSGAVALTARQISFSVFFAFFVSRVRVGCLPHPAYASQVGWWLRAAHRWMSDCQPGDVLVTCPGCFPESNECSEWPQLVWIRVLE